MAANKKAVSLKMLAALLAAICLLPLSGCGEKEPPTPTAGFYFADYELQRTDIDQSFTPWITLYEDYWGNIVYGPAESAMVFYTIEDNTLIMDHANFDRTYFFEIIDEKTLKLVDASAGTSHLKSWRLDGGIQIGDTFRWTEDLPEE